MILGKKRKIFMISMPGGASLANPLPPFEKPYVENFEADTVGDTEAILEAKLTHYDVYVTPTVQLIDYGLLPPIVGPLFTKCLTAPGNPGVGHDLFVSPGEGWVPSDGGEFLIEAVMFCSGTATTQDIYVRDAALQEGIQVGMSSTTFYLRTFHLGSATTKITIPNTLSSTPFGGVWNYLGAQYNLLTNVVYFRCIEFGPTAPSQEDTGWVLGGTVSAPTYDDSEWVHFQNVSASATAADCGSAQIRVGDALIDGYGLGQLATANYQSP